jgi:hypothetical protein
VSNTTATSGLVGQVKEVFPIFTKFVLGLSGAPYIEICEPGTDAPTKESHSQEAAGGILVITIILLIFSVNNSFDLQSTSGKGRIVETLIQYSALSVLAAFLPFKFFLEINRSDVICMVAIYWLPWFAVGIISYSIFPQAIMPSFFMPAITASLGMWKSRKEERSAGYIGVVILCFLMSGVSNWIYGALDIDTDNPMTEVSTGQSEAKKLKGNAGNQSSSKSR